MLELAHINVENLRDKEIGIELDEDIDLRSDSIGRFSRVSSLPSRISHMSGRSNRRLTTDQIIPLASKLKFGESEIHIGRIAYPKPPSTIMLSRHGSNRSINSNFTFESDYAQVTTKFYLGDHHSSDNEYYQDQDIDIPDAILEEDERNLTIQKSLKNERRITAMQVFETFAHAPLTESDQNEKKNSDDNKENLKED